MTLDGNEELESIDETRLARQIHAHLACEGGAQTVAQVMQAHQLPRQLAERLLGRLVRQGQAQRVHAPGALSYRAVGVPAPEGRRRNQAARKVGDQHYDLSVNQEVRAVLQKANRPLTAPEIRAHCQFSRARSTDNISAFLNKFVAKGLLVRHGEAPGVTYSLPPGAAGISDDEGASPATSSLLEQRPAAR